MVGYRINLHKSVVFICHQQTQRMRLQTYPCSQQPRRKKHPFLSCWSELSKRCLKHTAYCGYSLLFPKITNRAQKPLTGTDIIPSPQGLAFMVPEGAPTLKAQQTLKTYIGVSLIKCKFSHPKRSKLKVGVST